MAYSKTTWVDDVTPLSAANLNNMETGIETLETDKVAKVADLASQAQAEAGTDNTKYMTPLRTKEAVAPIASLISNSIGHQDTKTNIAANTDVEMVSFNKNSYKNIFGIVTTNDIGIMYSVVLDESNVRLIGVQGETSTNAKVVDYLLTDTNQNISTAGIQHQFKAKISGETITISARSLVATNSFTVKIF